MTVRTVLPAGELPLPPGVGVAGGAGGTQAYLVDLDAAAGAPERAAASLDVAAAHAGSLSHLIDSAARWSRSTAPPARAAVTRLVARQGGLRARADSARSTARSLREVADLYARTDLDVAGLLATGGVAAGGVVGELGPFGWLAAGTATVTGGLALVSGLIGLRLARQTPGPIGALLRTADAPALQRAGGPLGFAARTVGGPGLLPRSIGLPDARTVEPLVPGLASFLLAAAPGRGPVLLADPVPTTAGTLATAAAGGGMLLGAPTTSLVVVPAMGPTVRSGPAPTTPPRSTADVLRQIARLYPNPPGTVDRDGEPDPGGTPGTVGVQRLDHADGTRTWVVAIPGQETAGLGGVNPRDMTSNLQLVGGLPADATRLVTEAMTQAGVRPGEPVLLAGHSQGGLVAMTIATDPALADRFTVTTVVTAGSPVGSVVGLNGEPGVPAALLPEAQALHVEHLQDLVPVLDGRPNPDDPQRTTVVRDLGSAPSVVGRAAAGSPGAAHGIDSYVATAEEIAGLVDPSLGAFESSLAAVLGDGTATVTTQHYVGVRAPGPG